MTSEAQTIDVPRGVRRERMPKAAPSKVQAPPAAVAPILAERPLGLICLPLIALALWLSTHCYPGILGDAGVYIGRALADLDPNGVGRDMMFVHDGQSRFSLFPLLLDHLVASLGTSGTALLLALVSIAAWLAALAYFAERYVAKSFIAVVIIFVAVLPVNYGAPMRFGFSEVLAVARPFSEALVLAALAALAGRRTWLGLGFLLFASLVHPLMALPGWGVFALVLSREDWRWCAAFAGAALLFVAGAAAGLPVLHRLTIVMDPALKAICLEPQSASVSERLAARLSGRIICRGGEPHDRGEPRFRPPAVHSGRGDFRRRRRHRRAGAVRRLFFAAARHPGAALAHGLADGGARLGRPGLLRARPVAAGAEGACHSRAARARLALE